jgi:hypothetical protein
VRKHLVVTTAMLIATTAILGACSSSSSSKSSGTTTTTAPAASTTTSPPGGATVLTCTKFAGTLTLSPPISPTVSVAHTLTAKGTLSGCTGTPGITSGALTFVEKETAKLNCAEILSYTQPGTASASVKWNNGKTSTGSKLAVTYESVATSTISGKFTGGTAFVGKTSSATTTNSPNGGGCVTKGVSLETATLSLSSGTNYTIK